MLASFSPKVDSHREACCLNSSDNQNSRGALKRTRRPLINVLCLNAESSAAASKRPTHPSTPPTPQLPASFAGFGAHTNNAPPQEVDLLRGICVFQRAISRLPMALHTRARPRPTRARTNVVLMQGREAPREPRTVLHASMHRASGSAGSEVPFVKKGEAAVRGTRTDSRQARRRGARCR